MLHELCLHRSMVFYMNEKDKKEINMMINFKSIIILSSYNVEDGCNH